MSVARLIWDLTFLFFVLRCGVRWKFAPKKTLLICVFAFLRHGADQPKGSRLKEDRCIQRIKAF